MKEKILEIVSFGIEPERAELLVQQILDLFAPIYSQDNEQEKAEQKALLIADVMHRFPSVLSLFDEYHIFSLVYIVDFCIFALWKSN